MLGSPNYVPPTSTLFQVGLGSTKIPAVQGFDRERQEVPWFSYAGVKTRSLVLPRGPMLVSLDNTAGDADAQLFVGEYDDADAQGHAYLMKAPFDAPQLLWTVPMGEKASKVFTFRKDFLVIFVSGPFGALPFILQPLGIIGRSCASMPLAADGPIIPTGGGA